MAETIISDIQKLSMSRVNVAVQEFLLARDAVQSAARIEAERRDALETAISAYREEVLGDGPAMARPFLRQGA